MSFNLRRDVATDPHPWAVRREAIAEVVRAQQPDVLGTQEGLPHQLADLDARLPGYTRVGCDRAGDGSDEACSIYYSTRFDVIEHGTFWLSDTPEVPASRTWGNRHPRIATWARLLDTRTGRELVVANTHLDHESPDARQHAAKLIAQRLPGAILMGDLNVEPGDVTHTFLLGAGWDDAGARDPTYHAFTGEARARLDHVLAPRTHRIRAHRVVAHARASDHHAVVAEIEARE